MDRITAEEQNKSHPFLNFFCTAVQIGSYKFKPLEKVTISSIGITLTVPLPHKTSSTVSVWLPIKGIQKVLFCFCHSLPAVFVYCKTECSSSVRKALQMTDPNGTFYYDPQCNDDKQKRIILLPEAMSEEAKLTLRSILKHVLTEISRGLANELLVKSHPDESDSSESPLQQKLKEELAEQVAEEEQNEKNLHVMLSCRTVRIGSYKVKPSERVAIFPHGIEIQVPLPDDDSSQVKLWLPISDIQKIFVSFSRTLPVIFVYYKADCAGFLREALRMNDPKGPYYFDPDSTDEAHKRITLLPDKMVKEAKVGLKSVFQNVLKVTEINQKVSNDILVKSSPRESFQCLEMPTCSDVLDMTISKRTFTEVKDPHIQLFCRTIRIGTYEAKPNECVTITSTAIELHVPLPSIDPCVARITVPLVDLKKTLISFSRSMPVIFLYLKSSCAARVREILHMTMWNKFYYFDPDSDVEAHKRIILLPEVIPEEAELNLKSIFQYPHQKFMAEIYNKLANDILMKSYPSETHQVEPSLQNEKLANANC